MRIYRRPTHVTGQSPRIDSVHVVRVLYL